MLDWSVGAGPADIGLGQWLGPLRTCNMCAGPKIGHPHDIFLTKKCSPHLPEPLQQYNEHFYTTSRKCWKWLVFSKILYHQLLCVLYACMVQDWGVSVYQNSDGIQTLFRMIDFGAIGGVDWHQCIPTNERMSCRVQELSRLGLSRSSKVGRNNNQILHDRFL